MSLHHLALCSTSSSNNNNNNDDGGDWYLMFASDDFQGECKQDIKQREALRWWCSSSRSCNNNKPFSVLPPSLPHWTSTEQQDITAVWRWCSIITRRIPWAECDSITNGDASCLYYECRCRSNGVDDSGQRVRRRRVNNALVISAGMAKLNKDWLGGNEILYYIIVKANATVEENEHQRYTRRSAFLFFFF